MKALLTYTLYAALKPRIKCANFGESFAARPHIPSHLLENVSRLRTGSDQLL